MRLETTITEGAPQKVIEAFGSKKFASDFLKHVVGECLDIDDAQSRPAEFHTQKPCMAINTRSRLGVELRLTGVSRDNRKVSQFHQALKALYELAHSRIIAVDEEFSIQIFCVIILDADIETAPGSGIYSNIIEGEAKWIQLKR